MGTKLVSVEDFAIRAGLGEVCDIAPEILVKSQASIEAASVHLETYLRTSFGAVVAQEDLYYVDSDEFPWVGEFPRFYLSRGFITTAVASMDMKIASLQPDLSTATAISTTYMVLTQEKGTLLLTGTSEYPIQYGWPVSGDRYFAKLTYDAGFSAAADAYGTIYSGQPTWLVEVAVILAKQIFDTGVPCDESGSNANGCPCFIENLLADHIRFMPSALKPMD